MLTIDLCLGSSAERAQAEADWSLSGGIDRWHASSITPAVDAATEAMAEAATATRGAGATSPGAPEAATEGELDARAKGAPGAAEEADAAEAGLEQPRFLLHRSRSPKGSDPKASSSSEVESEARQRRNESWRRHIRWRWPPNRRRLRGYAERRPCPQARITVDARPAAWKRELRPRHIPRTGGETRHEHART